MRQPYAHPPPCKSPYPPVAEVILLPPVGFCGGVWGIMKTIDVKSLIIGALLTSTIFLGVAATGTTDKWDGKQRWEIKTSSGTIPEGWEPFAYDSNDEFDPFLLRRRIK